MESKKELKCHDSVDISTLLKFTKPLSPVRICCTYICKGPLITPRFRFCHGKRLISK